MKKLVMTAAVLACATSMVAAQTVTSANIVGYNKDTLPTGLKISAYQFGSGSASSVYGNQYPLGTKIYTYTAGVGYGSISTYESAFDFTTFTMVTDWNPSVTLNQGQGYWLENTGSAAEAIVSGEVPLADSVTNSIAAGLQLISYPYPVAMDVADMEFSPSIGDKIYTYTAGVGYGSISTYESAFDFTTFTMVTSWNPAASVGVGEGVWYEAVAPHAWIVNRPFNP